MKWNASNSQYNSEIRFGKLRLITIEYLNWSVFSSQMVLKQLNCNWFIQINGK